MAIFERQLLLQGPIFDFHDSGRKSKFPDSRPCAPHGSVVYIFKSLNTIPRILHLSGDDP